MRVAAGLLATGLAVAALVPAPARAEDGRAGDIAEKLNDPMTQFMVSSVLVAMSEAMLDVRIEPLVRAMERIRGDPVPDLPPDARVRDLAGPEAERLPGQIARTAPQVMGSMGEMAAAVDEMLPEFRAMAERMKEAIPGY